MRESLDRWLPKENGTTLSSVLGSSRVLVLCPDNATPSGGIRRLYRHVDVLRKHGVEAWLVHETKGFRCNWFAHSTPIMSLVEADPKPSDFLVFPEIFASGIAALAPGVPKVIFNQNAYLTFQTKRALEPNAKLPYFHPDVIAVFAVSEDNANYLQYAFPGLKVHRLHYGIDPIFAPRWPKRRAIAYMPRKNADHVVQVLSILRHRNALNGWEVEAIDGLPEKKVAEKLASSALFLSFGTFEGCALPPLEAMASGCVVVGYHGHGGREYFDPAFNHAIEVGDVIGFAQAVENALRREIESPGLLERQGKLAADHVRTHYSPEIEERDVVDVWNGVGRMTGRGVSSH
jgi:glycosyltransferase involved in cell wall biosynthesis